MSAHTPGPWVRDEDNCGGGAGLVAVGKSKSGKGGPRVAWTSRVVSGGVVVISDDEAKANADLIAAAPELLAALTEWAECCDCTAYDLDTANCVHAPARSAIAKARGAQ